MGDPLNLTRLLHWGLFAAIALGLLLLKTLPMDVGAGHWPGPDLILTFAMVWVLRRPDFLPLWLLAPVALLADFILMRPPGLWAALSLISVEYLRNRAGAAREWSIMVEWGITTLVLTIMILIHRLVLALFAVPQAPLGLDLQQLLSSAAAYPLVILLCVRFLGLRRPLATEASLS